MNWINVEKELPDIEEPVLILFGDEYDQLYNRIETGRRSMVNDTDWCWYGFANNTMRLNVVARGRLNSMDAQK